MNCVNCNTINDDTNVYCVSCGNLVSQKAGSSGGYDSVETEVFETGRPFVSGPNFQPTPANLTTGPGVNKTLWIVLGAIVAILIAGGIYIFVNKNTITETLPDHIGLFAQYNDRKELTEIGKQDVTNALTARNDLSKNDSLPVLDPSPNLIFFWDGKAVPDAKLIQLDTIADTGGYRYVPVQVVPVEGKPDINKLRITTALANGRYALALLDGPLNEGKHKFWAFQIRNSSKSDNGDTLKETTAALKATPTPAPPVNRAPAPAPVPVAPPAPGRTAVSIADYVILRAGPGQSYPKIRNLARGETVTILEYSTNTEVFKGRAAPFARVRTLSGPDGWVFSAFLR